MGPSLAVERGALLLPKRIPENRVSALCPLTAPRRKIGRSPGPASVLALSGGIWFTAFPSELSIVQRCNRSPENRADLYKIRLSNAVHGLVSTSVEGNTPARYPPTEPKGGRGNQPGDLR